METNDLPISEQFRRAAETWVDLEAAAKLLEDTKKPYFSELVNQQGDVPVNRAEHNVQSGRTWRDYIEKTSRARTAANKAWVQVEYFKMRFSEWQSAEANARVEARL